MIFKEKLLKKYPLEIILQPLIQDLKQLENGIVVNDIETRRIKCGVVCYSADNLEASLVGGFSSNFSSRDICRICHINYNQLEEEVSDFHEFWSVEEYDSICAQRSIRTGPTPVDNNADNENLFWEDYKETEEQGDENESSNDEVENVTRMEEHGLNNECPLNALASFHCVNSFPLDLMHDLFEGQYIF